MYGYLPRCLSQPKKFGAPLFMPQSRFKKIRSKIFPREIFYGLDNDKIVCNAGKFIHKTEKNKFLWLCFLRLVTKDAVNRQTTLSFSENPCRELHFGYNKGYVIKETFITKMLDNDNQRELLRDPMEPDQALSFAIDMAMGQLNQQRTAANHASSVGQFFCAALGQKCNYCGVLSFRKPIKSPKWNKINYTKTNS